MITISLAGEPRKILGKKVRKLRREGIVPAHIFGHKIKTSHIQVLEKDFQKVEKEAGETGVVELKIGGEVHPVLIRDVQVDPVTDEPLHIDFYQVNLKEKVKVHVPIETIGESPAVESKLGVLLAPLSEIEIEALPSDLPESIKIDISKLQQVDAAILVKDLKIPAGVEILADPDETVVKIGELVTKEAVEILAEEEAERAEAVEESGEPVPTESEEKVAEEQVVQGPDDSQKPE